MRRAFVVVLVLSSLIGCAARTEPPKGSVSSNTARPTALTGSNEEIRAAAERDAVERVAKAKASDEPVPLPSGPAAENTMKLAVTLNRVCARTGDEMRATAVTAKGAKIAFAAAYSDNSLVPDFTYVPGDGNPTGTFTWTWVIRPDIPPGDAILTVVASKGSKGATVHHPFRIARAC